MKEFHAHSAEGRPVEEWHRLEEHEGAVPDLRTERNGVPSLVIARDRIPKQSQPFGTGSESGLSPLKRRVADFADEFECGEWGYLAGLWRLTAGAWKIRG